MEIQHTLFPQVNDCVETKSEPLKSEHIVPFVDGFQGLEKWIEGMFV